MQFSYFLRNEVTREIRLFSPSWNTQFLRIEIRSGNELRHALNKLDLDDVYESLSRPATNWNFIGLEVLNVQ